MPTYIMLSTLTPEGVQTVKNNPQRIREVNKEIEQLGATVNRRSSSSAPSIGGEKAPCIAPPASIVPRPPVSAVPSSDTL